MENILIVICLAFGVIGILSVILTLYMDKKLRQQVEVMKKSVERKNNEIKSLSEENEFLKHQAGDCKRWLEGITEEMNKSEEVINKDTKAEKTKIEVTEEYEDVYSYKDNPDSILKEERMKMSEIDALLSVEKMDFKSIE